MTRIDHFNNPHAPKANRIVPATSAVIENDEGKILLHRRSDNKTWALPGGTMETGEGIGESVRREVKEETGLEVVLESLVGIYSDPKHVIEYLDGEVRQEFSICFACKVTGGKLQISEESLELAFFSPQQIEQLAMHPSIRLRIKDYLEHRLQPVIS
ncbi:MAG: NUDIX domain-containing protein [Ktedonobacteraceae bacterium]|nr:NUDIX domain-containing protein [Ktedonobacteraceae bacterium]